MRSASRHQLYDLGKSSFHPSSVHAISGRAKDSSQRLNQVQFPPRSQGSRWRVTFLLFCSVGLKSYSLDAHEAVLRQAARLFKNGTNQLSIPSQRHSAVL